jgi:hypothetical protein
MAVWNAPERPPAIAFLMTTAVAAPGVRTRIAVALRYVRNLGVSIARFDPV